MENLFVVWDVSPVLFNLGNFALRWYGLLFALGFIIGQQLMTRIFAAEGRDPKAVEKLTIYMVVATIIGARLGHCLFYEPDYYLSHPIKILFVWEGGLASHGGAIGILVALYLYSRKFPDQSYLWILDRIVIVVALAGALIRTGNLMNSEIVGKPTDAEMGFIFARPLIDNFTESFPNVDKIEITPKGADTIINGVVCQPLLATVTYLSVGRDPNSLKAATDALLVRVVEAQQNSGSDKHFVLMPPHSYIQSTSGRKVTVSAFLYGIPRHPTQIYEATTTFAVFLLLGAIWLRFKAQTPNGLLIGLFSVIVFGLRFVHELFKENQVAFENEMQFNMGQILSLPLIALGLFWIINALRKREKQ